VNVGFIRGGEMKGYCALCLAWCVACLSTSGSLFFSEGLSLETCQLCWLQRVCIYPLVLILGMAIYNCCYTVIPYVMPQLCLGCCFAVYQVAIQANPALDFLPLCQTGPNCTEVINIGMGFLTLPMLSACACSLMMGCLFYAWRQAPQDEQLAYVRMK
jgi:disulfide bond formation protein DsbB